ncbi:hypothetical protein N9Z12_00985 [Opitutaceae bacterium]|nr:hypothetical protein [Opitutaceae bacterium]
MPVDSTRSPSRRLRVWTIFWIVAGVIHLTQAIWVSGGANLPGGLGDGRFNNLVLEHGYQSIRGNYDWNSPGQFYPVENTLGMSDSHVGTLPAYALTRALGFSTERAMQIWFILIAALNLILAVMLLRELKLSESLVGPIAFGAFSGVPWVWMTGTHAQLLPIFPALWGFIHLARFVTRRNLHELAIVAAAMLGQFAVGPYLAFFSAFAVAVAAIVAAPCRLMPQPFGSPCKVARTNWIFAGIGGILGVINLWIYSQAVNSGLGRPMQEVTDLAPTWASWFSAPSVHSWWRGGLPGGSLELSEHVLFSGLFPFILSIGVLIWGLRNRHIPEGILAVLFSATAWLIILVTVRWPNGFSLWIEIAERVEPLRAFRAIGRIHIMTHALMLGAIGFAFSALLQSGKRNLTLIGGILLGATLLEGIGSHQPAYSITQAQTRREALVQAWHLAGDSPVLAFSPGYTNQPDPHVQLDAWAAALANGKRTINGYTGGAPLSHLRFIWNPSAEQAHALIKELGIPASDVSIVTQYPKAVADRVGFAYQEQRSLAHLEGFDLQPASWELFTPLETYRIGEKVYYQFTPPCSVEFTIPDAVAGIRLHTGMRDGAFTGDNDSDGYRFAVRVEDGSGYVLAEETELINPRDNAEQRGMLERGFSFPPGKSRRLVLEFGSGPANSNAWDWPLLGELKAE